MLVKRFGWLAELAASPHQGSTGSGAGYNQPSSFFFFLFFGQVSLAEFFGASCICDGSYIGRGGEVLSPEESPSSAEWTRGSRLHSVSVLR